MAQVWLYAHEDKKALAWSDDGVWYYNAHGGGVFGWRQDNWLYKQPGNERIGFFQDQWLFTPDSKPLAWLSK